MRAPGPRAKRPAPHRPSRGPTAFTGHFRIEGDKFITTADGAWNEAFKANEQVRLFTLDGDTLTVRVPEQPSGLEPGKRNASGGLYSQKRNTASPLILIPVSCQPFER